MARHTFHYLPGTLGHRYAWILFLALVVGLAGYQENAIAAPPVIPEEDAGGGAWDVNTHNEHAALRFFDEVLSQRTLEVSPLLMAVSVTTHTPVGDFAGLDGFEAYVSEAWRAFPQATFVVDEQHSADELVTVRWTMTGRQLAAFGDQAATGKAVHLQGIAILRFESGKIAESWIEYDRMSLVEQIAQPVNLPDICPPCAEP